MGSLPEPELKEKFAAILSLSGRWNSERELSPLLDLIARDATRMLDCDRARVFLLDRERNELCCKVPNSDEFLRFDARLGIAGEAVAGGQTVNVGDASHDARFNAALYDQTGYQTQNALATPVRNQQGSVAGALEAMNKYSGQFTHRDEETLESLAAHAASAIETAQLIADLRRGHDELAGQNAALRREVESRYSSRGIVGAGPQIQEVVRLIERIRESVVNVLITGESGTGKELVAKAIHYTSPRARKPFVALDCSALPQAAIESELFGEGGVNGREGHFQKADGGTLFLDEISELSLPAQARVLRVLQERAVEREGGGSPVPVDVRLLAASRKDVEPQIARGNFREDFYYRIKVIHIHMPPLREMSQEIPLLANHFLEEYCRESRRSPVQFSAEVLRKLADSPWPGNIRQLRNEVFRLAAYTRSSVIQEADLRQGLALAQAAAAPGGVTVAPVAKAPRPQFLKEAVEALEREMIAEALETTRQNQQRSARRLGLSRQGLINKLKRYGF